MLSVMATVRFLPFYADTLDQVLGELSTKGDVHVAVRPGLDPAVVANQIGAYASSVGIPVRCRPEGDQIRVRVIQRHPTRPVERAG